MYTATLREVKRAFNALPTYEPQTHAGLLWWVKDFYKGERFVKMTTIHRALGIYVGITFNAAKINGERMFWRIEKSA